MNLKDYMKPKPGLKHRQSKSLAGRSLVVVGVDM